uniref:Dihydroorotate oxidase n=1 Tax=Setaria digitata TaxID=48799 RepID=A0A915PRG4_9BILA
MNCVFPSEHITGFQRSGAELLRDFSWSAKLVGDCDTAVENLVPIVVLTFHFTGDAEAIKGLRKSGFGFIEVGTVTPLPQKTDSESVTKFLSEDEGCLSCGKFKSAGLNTVYLLVKKAYDRNADVPLGVNIGRNAELNQLKTDYNLGVYYFGPFSDYLVLNFAGQTGPEKITDVEIALQAVASAVKQLVEANEPSPKILIKIPSDLTILDLKAIIEIALNKRYGVDGIIISNSTARRPKNLETALEEDGFLSGRPLRDMSTNCIRDVYRISNGKIPIIGCGGISSGQDAYEKIRAGASFPVIGRIKRELVECLSRDGFCSVSEAVGADHKK